jgi:hypothetical protein
MFLQIRTCCLYHSIHVNKTKIIKMEKILKGGLILEIGLLIEKIRIYNFMPSGETNPLQALML